MNSYTVDELYRLAQDGNTEALVKLGLCYKEGNQVEADPGAAAQCFYSAARAQNPGGMYQLAVCYEEGIGLECDPKAAAYWYQEAAKLFYEAARLGNPQAQYGLANCYSEGRGVERDPKAAVYWYQAAAQQDYADAQYNLGYCYLFGIGVEANEVVALKWYQSAAEHGDPQMQHNLGLIYKNGYGSVTRNYGKAAEWFFKAARQGYSQSKAELALIYFSDPAAVKDVSVAERLMTEAAEDGVQDAQLYLMHYYFDRDPSKADIKKAYTWASKVANSGQDLTACVIIGLCCADGSLFEKDEKLAYTWLSQAENDTDLLSGDACYYLGKFYQEGQAAERSYEKASYYYSLAQEKGSSLAEKGILSLRAELKKKTKKQQLQSEGNSNLEDTRIFEDTDELKQTEVSADTRVFTGDELEKTRAAENAGGTGLKEAEKRNPQEQDSLDEKSKIKKSSSFERLRKQVIENKRVIEEIPSAQQTLMWDEDERMLIRAYEDEPEETEALSEEEYEDESEETEDLPEEEYEDESEETEDLPEEEYEDESKETEDLPEEEYEDESEETEDLSEEEYEDESEEAGELIDEEHEEELFEDEGEENSDEDWEFPTGFRDRMQPVGKTVSSSGDENGAVRNSVVLDEITDMENELVDYGGDGDVGEPEEEEVIDTGEPEEEDDEEWESTDDHFLASLFATGARVTNTSMATPKRKQEPEAEKAQQSEENQDLYHGSQYEESVSPEDNDIGFDGTADSGFEGCVSDAYQIEKTQEEQQLQEEPEPEEEVGGEEAAAPVPKRELIIDDDVLEEWEQAPEDGYDEISAASGKPISSRLREPIPIHEVSVDENGTQSDTDLQENREAVLEPEEITEPVETAEEENLSDMQEISDFEEAEPEEAAESEEAEPESEETTEPEEAVQEHEGVSEPEETALEEVFEPEKTDPEEKPGETETGTELSPEDDIAEALQEALKDVFRDEEKAELQENEPDQTEAAVLGRPVESVIDEAEEKEIPQELQEEEAGKIHWVLITLIMIAGSVAVAAAILFATGNWPLGSSSGERPNFFFGREASSQQPVDVSAGVTSEEAKIQAAGSVETTAGEKATDESDSELPVTTEEETTVREEAITTEEETTVREEVITTEEETTVREEVITTEEETTVREEAITTEEETTVREEVITTEEETTAGEEVITTEEETTAGEEVTTAEEMLSLSDIPQFSDMLYTETEVPVSGCVYAKLGSYDEKDGRMYAGKATEMDMAHVAENALGMNVIGSTVFYYVAEGDYKTVYSVPEAGGEPVAAARNIEGNPELFIMNNSIFAGNREYEIGTDPDGVVRKGVARFLTFTEDIVYYMTENGKIAENTYNWDSEKILDIPVETEDTVWAQALGGYLLFYSEQYGLLSFNPEDGTLVRIPFEGIESCSGLAGNGNWIYGILEDCVVRVRPNGSGLETVSTAPAEGSWGHIIHATEHYVTVTIDEGADAGDYLVNPQNHEYALIVKKEQ